MAATRGPPASKIDTTVPLDLGEKYMPLISLVIVLIVVGVLLWAINTYIPMDGKIKSILNIVVVIVVVLWLLNAFGVLGSLESIRIGQ
jgi:hypothetical protein